MYLSHLWVNLAATFCVLPGCFAFTTTSLRSGTILLSRSSSCPSQTLLNSTTRKKRRRRKEDGSFSQDNAEGDGNESPLKDSDLPDFDISDSGGATSAPNSGTTGESSSPRASKDASYIDPLGEITPNMMGSANRPGAKSVRELLNDRSLERKFEFLEDTSDDNSLPDLLKLGTPKPTEGLSKRERQTARRLELQNTKSASQEKEGVWTMIASKLPLIRDEKGNISAIKILENATWVCIWVLVAWEVYLNSPFFERAAPMAPVVY
jgi:hypothetical protein